MMQEVWETQSEAKERFGGHERSSRKTNRFDQLFRRFPDEVVVVNDSDQWGTSQCHLPTLMFEE